LKRPGISVAVVIKKDEKYLLGRRHPHIVGGNYWCLPMGKLEWGENLIDCARREVLEEAGISVLEVKPIALANVILTDSHYLTLGFLATVWAGKPEITAPQEIVEWNWYNFNNLPKPLFQPSKEIIEASIKTGTFSNSSVIEINNI
jgi:8-oxo-dGTP diphosphatase